jgi:hypothetical protein
MVVVLDILEVLLCLGFSNTYVLLRFLKCKEAEHFVQNENRIFEYTNSSRNDIVVATLGDGGNLVQTSILDVSLYLASLA